MKTPKTLAIAIICTALLASAVPVCAASRPYAAVRAQGETSFQMDWGESKEVVLKFKNTGTKTWKNSGPGYISLYLTRPAKGTSVFRNSWPGSRQAAKLVEKTVKPGQTGTFKLELRAPENTATYAEQYQLASENVAWVWSSAVKLSIKVVEPPVTAATPVHAKAYVALDAATGKVLAESGAEEVRSIASLTKLMTALVVRDAGVDPGKVVTLQRSDEVGGGRLRVRLGTGITVNDLMASAIVASANNAANAMARATDLPKADFVRKMNERAASMGLARTVFTDPTGIEPTNMSTALEVGRLALAAFKDPVIGSLASQPTYHVTLANTGADHDIKNTNKLLADTQVRSVAGKTGFIYESGYSLATMLSKPGEGDVLVVVLGCDTQNQEFRDAKAVAERAWAVSQP